MSSSSRFRGILSNRGNNRTDDQTRSMSQMILSMIGVRAITLKNPSYLIDTLYYTTLNTENLTFIPFLSTTDSPFSGITVTHMTSSAYVIDTTTTLTFVGYRIPISSSIKSQFSSAQYNETITIQTSEGSLTATATYSDSGSGFETSGTSQTYMVNNGIGKYAYAKFITILFDNDLNRRQVLVYAYLNS